MTIATKTMTTQEVADQFYSLSLEGKFDVIVDELYDVNAKSIEPANALMWQNVEGIDKIRTKAVQFQSIIEEMFGGYTNKPEVAGNFFVCTMGMDVKMKGHPRMKLDEVAVYEVQNGKIVLEQFFF